MTGQKVLHHFPDHQKRPIAVAFLAREPRLVSAGIPDDHFTVWDLQRGRKLKEYPSPQDVTCLAVSPDDKILAFGRSSSAVGLMDLRTGTNVSHLRGAGGPLRAVLFLPDAKRLATAEVEDSTVRVFSLAAPRNPDSINLFPFFLDQQKRVGVNEVLSLAASPDGKILAAGCRDGTIRLNGLPSGKTIAPLAADKEPVIALCFSQDGKGLTSVCRDGAVRLWALDNATKGKREIRRPMTGADVARYWSQLFSADETQNWRALEALAASPKETVDFVAARVKPAPIPDFMNINQLIDELQFAESNRSKEIREALIELGEPAEVALRKRAQDPRLRLFSRDIERVRRLEEALRDIRKSEVFLGFLRTLYAIEILERTESAQARPILETLARGWPESKVTHWAKAALIRIRR